MRFSLQDIKKSVQRRKGELVLSLHLLRPGELTSEITELIAYHERLLGQPQRRFSHDEARALIGDYRLAHCLIATLSHWYSWQHPSWQEIASAFSPHTELAALSASAQLRLDLYTYVNEHYQGFLDYQSRDAALCVFSARYGLTVPNLEYLLVLDSDEEAQLQRTTSEQPTPQQVAILYNQWAFEATLGSASSVHFTIDCNAFSNIAQQVESSGIATDSIGKTGTTGTLTTGVGLAIKRLCYLARTIGVYYDLAYEPSLNSQQLLLSLTLYGPQEVTGVPQQYGIRLARLCRSLLGYSRTSGKQKGTQLINAILESSATVHMLQRSYVFNMSSDLLRLLPMESEQHTNDFSSEKAENTYTVVFDSSIEQSFAEAFAALERSRAVDQWRLEREPEPLLLEQSIFIPDFALTREQHRIYVEILGFWSPSYRERKVQKLLQLRSRDDILLAIPAVAKDAYTQILADYPVVFYDEQLSATDVLGVLRTVYDDFAARLASINVNVVRARVYHSGLLAEQMCLDALHCYRRSELLQAVSLVTNDEIVFTPGIGLYTQEWISHIKDTFISWMPATGIVSLSSACEQFRMLDPVLNANGDELLEVCIEMWPELRIERDSIFDATLQLTTTAAVSEEPSLLYAGEIDTLKQAHASAMTVRESSTTLESRQQKRNSASTRKQKRVVKETQETTQEQLWD